MQNSLSSVSVGIHLLNGGKGGNPAAMSLAFGGRSSRLSSLGWEDSSVETSLNTGEETALTWLKRREVVKRSRRETKFFLNIVGGSLRLGFDQRHVYKERRRDEKGLCLGLWVTHEHGN
jgi:hypothetical protein